MSSAAMNVLLHGEPVGEIVPASHGRWAFRFATAYPSRARRPVLGQSFEDDLEREYVCNRAGRLPAFFANLVPEPGQLRTLLEARFGIEADDDPGILRALGRDLAGAVEVVPSEDLAPSSGESSSSGRSEAATTGSATGGLRFSLAGVQLKFSMVREGRGLTVPASDERGKWIAKIDAPEYPGLVENEFTVMDWARRAGFDVPEHELVATDRLVGLPQECTAGTAHAFVIRRFDRDEDRRVHQEDFAQVIGAYPAQKYDATYEALGKLVHGIVGLDGFDEYVRRLALMLAAGNNDAHLKNWSFIYPDRVRARLAPVYDQVCTAHYPRLDKDLALKLGGSRSAAAIDARTFERLAARAGVEADRVVDVARTTIRTLAACWPATTVIAESVRIWWARVPILRETVALA